MTLDPLPAAFLDELLDLFADAVLEDLVRFPDLDCADGPGYQQYRAGERQSYP